MLQPAEELGIDPRIRRTSDVGIVRMIKAILVFNNHGKPRLTKFYQYYVRQDHAARACFIIFVRQAEDMQQQIVRETFQLVSKRDDNVCNFLEGGRSVSCSQVTSG